MTLLLKQKEKKKKKKEEKKEKEEQQQQQQPSTQPKINTVNDLFSLFNNMGSSNPNPNVNFFKSNKFY